MKRESDNQSKATQVGEIDHSPLVIGRKIPRDKTQPPVILTTTKIGEDCFMIESPDAKSIKFVDNANESFSLKNISQFAQNDQFENFTSMMRQNTPTNNAMTPLTVVRNSVRTTNQQMVKSSEVLQFIEQIKNNSKNLNAIDQKKVYDLCLSSYTQLLEEQPEIAVPKSIMTNLTDMRKIVENSNPQTINPVNPASSQSKTYSGIKRPSFTEQKTEVATHMNTMTGNNSAENYSPKNYPPYNPELLQMLQRNNDASPSLLTMHNIINYMSNSSPMHYASPQILPSPFNTGRHNQQQMFRQNTIDFSGYFEMWKSYGYNAKNQ
jgi:hypothetical protein